MFNALFNLVKTLEMLIRFVIIAQFGIDLCQFSICSQATFFIMIGLRTSIGIQQALNGCSQFSLVMINLAEPYAAGDLKIGRASCRERV